VQLAHTLLIEQIQAIEPLRPVFQARAALLDLAVTADGATVYAVHAIPAIDLGAVLDDTIHYWFTPFAIVLLCAALWALRCVAQRPQRSGVPYCRRCGYDVSGCASPAEPCPECGVDLGRRPPKLGRALWRRLWFPLVLIVLCIGTTASIWGFRQAGLKLFTPLDWLSIGAQRWVNVINRPLPKGWGTRAAVFVAVDSTTGTWRQLRTNRAGKKMPLLRCLPDGSLLIVEHGAFLCLNAKTGKVIARLRVPGFQPVVPLSQATDVLPTGELLVQVSNAATKSSAASGRLIAWSPPTKKWRTIAETPWNTDPDVVSGWRGFMLVPGDRHERFLNFPMRGSNSVGTHELRWFDSQGTHIASTTLSNAAVAGIDCIPPRISADGSELYLSVDRLSARRTFNIDGLVASPAKAMDARSPHVVRTFELQKGSANENRSGDGRFAITNQTKDILVRTRPDDTPVAHLKMPPDLNWIQVALSHNGTCIAARAFPFRKRIVYSPELFIWHRTGVTPDVQPEPP